jgi:hypothetical protein
LVYEWSIDRAASFGGRELFSPGRGAAMLAEEVRDTANLYLDGKIDQWYSQQNGVVFIFT